MLMKQGVQSVAIDPNRLRMLTRKVPPILWKYCGTRAVPLIDTLRLKLTRPNEFNDPFELSPGAFGTLTAVDVERFYDDPEWVAHWNPPSLPEDPDKRRGALEIGARTLGSVAAEIMAEELARTSETRAVICLSADPSSLLMWSHYSENHCGFVVGIAPRRLGDLPIFPVEYVDRRVVYKATTPLKVHPEPRVLDMFLRKARQWSYEREFRSIWPLTELIPGSIGDTPAHFLPLSGEAIVEVRLGCRASAALETNIRQALHAVGSPAQLLRARLHPRSYKLEFVRI